MNQENPEDTEGRRPWPTGRWIPDPVAKCMLHPRSTPALTALCLPPWFSLQEIHFCRKCERSRNLARVDGDRWTGVQSVLEIIPETNKILVLSGVHHERDAYIFFLTRILPRFRKTDQSKTWCGSNNLRFDTAQILWDLAQTLNRKFWFIFWNCPYKINICSRKVRTHSPAICPCPYHSCLCTHQITIHTTQVTDRAYECTRGTCLGANTTQVAGAWMMVAGDKADRKAVCELGELPRCPRTARNDALYNSGKSENQRTNEEKENPEKEETPVIVTASTKGPSSAFTKPRCRLWSMGLEKMPSASTLLRRDDSYRESCGLKEVWKRSLKE